MEGTAHSQSPLKALLHPALWLLLWLDFKGSMRGLANVRKSWRQLALLLLMLGFVGLFIGIRASSQEYAQAGRFGEAMPFWALIYLLMTWLTASADRGLVMRPAEIHFVAGGPFRDRDVITINLLRLGFRSLISATVLSLITSLYLDSFLSGLLGMWMLIGVSLLVGMIASLSARKAQRGIVKGLRRLFTAAAIAALLMLVVQSLQAVKDSGNPVQVSAIAAAAQDTPVGRYVLPPLEWMFRPLSSKALYPTTIELLPARFAVLALMIGSIYLLGGNYLEASTNRTSLSMAKRQAASRSGSHTSVGWTSRIRIPPFGHWGGVGAVAWMQVLHAIRILPRFLVFTVVIVGVVLVIPLMLDPERIAGNKSIAWMAGLTAYADFLLLLQLPVGFLGPVAQREMLKSLPIPSWRLVIGQLAGPVFPILMLHMLVMGLFLWLLPQNAYFILLTSIALIPAAMVVIANVNLLGCWNVIRPRALQQRDALAAGRAMASVWIFFAMLTPAIVAGVAASVCTRLLFGGSVTATILGAAGGVFVSSFLYIALIARSFSRWQPSSREGGGEEKELER